MSFSLTNIADLLAHAAATWSTAPALSDRTNKITYDRLDGRVNALAQGLTDLGVQPGDRVAIITDKSIDIVAAMFGCYRAGAVLVPVNPLLKAPQVAHILNDSDARLLLAAEKRLPLLESLSDQAALRAVLPAGTDQPAPLEGQGGLPAPVAAPSGFDTDELATLFYTSGSTGLPKAVACTHANILAGAESVASYLENTSDDVILAILPLSFDAGYSQLTTAFQSGAHVILQDYLLPRDISRAAEQHGVTGITGVPAIWAATVKASWSDEARNRLRYFANTGGHLQQERINQLMQLFPKASPYPMYGLTEAFRSAYLPPDRIADKPGSMGRAIPGAKLFVLDETGALCAG